jgi:membrane protease subunit HflK
MFDVFQSRTMSNHPHSHDEHEHAAPETPVDAGSQALAEALRSSFAIVKFAMVALVLVFLASGFFTVGPQEKAVILRFGKPVGEGDRALLGAGLHWSFPYPIDEYVKIPITEIQTIKSSVGWFAQTPDQELLGQIPPAGNSLNPAVDGYVLTGDGNIIHAKATLRYRISDPIRYIFNFTSASNLVQNALDNALLSTAARFKVDDILYHDIAGFREAVRRRTTELLNAEKAGVTVEQCTVVPLPPRQLTDAFANVLNAEINRDTVIQAAHTYENQITNQASANAASIINLAETESTNRVQFLAAEAARFNQLLPGYQTNSHLFVVQHLYETLGRVLANAQEKWIEPTASGGISIENRIMLNRERPKPKPGAN